MADLQDRVETTKIMKNTAVEISLKISGLDEGQNEDIDGEVVDLLLEIYVI